MADIQHSTLPSSAVHEPKHIGVNGVNASGRVITNSSSTTGESEYRRLKGSDIEELNAEILVLEIDSSVAQTHYIPTTFNGTITKFTGIVNTALAGGNNTYELQLDGVTVTGSALTFTTASGNGGDAGDIVEVSPSSANNFIAGQALTIVNTALGNTDADLNIRFVISIDRD